MSSIPSRKVLCKLLEKYTDKELYQKYRLSKSSLDKWRVYRDIDPIIHPERIAVILKRRKEGMSFEDLAYMYNTSSFVIKSVCSFRSWDTLNPKPPKRKYNKHKINTKTTGIAVVVN